MTDTPPSGPDARTPPAPAAPAWRRLAQGFGPAPLAIGVRERWRVALGVALGLLVAAALSRWAATGGPLGAPGPSAPPLPAAWLMAPLGASAVLVFGLPSSPLAQPWAVVAGNLVSALAGLAVVALLPADTWPPLLAALAAGAAVAGMLALRCLHPPGGGTALLAVLGSAHHWGFAVFPVSVNAVLLVLAGIAYNRATGRAYPHPDRGTAPPPPGVAARFSDADLDRVLARHNQLVDLPRDELRQLLAAAEGEAHRRRLGALQARDIMTTPALSVAFGTPLQDAWALLRQHHIKALPVVDRTQRVVGILTLADFLRGADLDRHDGFDHRLRRLLRPTPTAHTDKPEAVGQIMTRQVRVASEHRSLAELVPIFSATGHHHLPVIDADGRLCGVLTQTDLVRALVTEAGGPPPPR